MSLRAQVKKAVKARDFDGLEALALENPSALHYLVGLLYKPEAEIRDIGARCLASAATRHPKKVKECIRRLVWAMNEDASTNAVTIPLALETIARQRPDLLLTVLPDLIQLSADPALREGLTATIHVLAEVAPAQVCVQLNEAGPTTGSTEEGLP